MSRLARQRRQHRSPLGRIVLFSLLAALVVTAGGATYAISWVVSTADSAPSLSSLAPRIEGQVSEVFAADGSLLGYLSTDVLRRAVPQSAQPLLLREATVAIEDRRFYHHGGVDYQGLFRAAFADVFNGSAGTQGGSTLTMQLVKNIYVPLQLVKHGGLRYKIVQAKLATEMADHHTKDWILTQYLNDVPYGTVGGQTAYGVEAASQMFFDQPDLAKLDLAQVALLAGLPQAPTALNPFNFPSDARLRRSEVLAAMVKAGYVTPAQASIADGSPLQVKLNHAYNTVRQPYVFDFIRQQLINRLGVRAVDRGGLRVDTSINLRDQAYAQQALLAHEGQPGDPDAVVVSVDPSTGDIVAMAQNTRYGQGSGETTVNYVTQAYRQTGSAFKTFALMNLIHSQDGDPNSTYYVSKKLDPGWYPAVPSYSVHTSEESYQGVINITHATTVSDNTVYAQLAVDLGVPSVLDTAYSMGITTHQLAVPSIVIGGLNPGVTPLQMADAYATLANGGSHYTPTILTRVTLPSGRTLDLQDTHPDRVFSAAEAYAGTQVLGTVLTGQGGTGTAAEYGCPAAGKTGTTSNFTDAWFVGYTPTLSTAVWVGYTREADQMQNVNGLGPGFGGTLAAPIWHDFMAKASPACTAFPVPSPGFSGTAYKGAHAVGGQDYTSTSGGYGYSYGPGGAATGAVTTPTTATKGKRGPDNGGALNSAGTVSAPPATIPAAPPPTVAAGNGNGNGNAGSGASTSTTGGGGIG